jgi:phosphoribosylamine--glycine ligase
MNLLILGSGGREHALAWRLSHDQGSSKIYIWPGNDGISGEKIEIVDLPFNQRNFILFTKENNIRLVIPGAEKYLFEGISDWCRDINLPCFGPSPKASKLEKSKIFSKKLMFECEIPTSRFLDLTHTFNHHFPEALNLVDDFKRPVIKISGPSLGKGVFVCSGPNEAKEILKKLKESPQAGMEDGLLVEEGVVGKEVSLFFACSGEDFLYLGSAQDYKRLFDGDKGPNTGGMGAISPVPWVKDEFISKVIQRILVPTLKKMSNEGTPYVGILFLGLMVNADDFYLLEYNTRFGDPETQALLPVLEGDLTKCFHQFSCGTFFNELNPLKFIFSNLIQLFIQLSLTLVNDFNPLKLISTNLQYSKMKGINIMQKMDLTYWQF